MDEHGLKGRFLGSLTQNGHKIITTTPVKSFTPHPNQHDVHHDL